MGCAPGFCVTSRLLSLFPPRRVENNYPLPQQLLQKHCLWFTCRRSARFANAKHHNYNSATNAAEAESPCFTRGLLKPLLPTAKLFRDQALVFFTHLSGRHNQARPFLPHLPSTACRLFLQGSVAATAVPAFTGQYHNRQTTSRMYLWVSGQLCWPAADQ